MDPADIRLCEHLSYSKRINYINKYLILKQIKYQKYIKTRKIYLFNNKWWDNNNGINNINLYMTYQKTLINEKEINGIILKSNKLLNDNIKNNHKVQLYYKYQQPIGKLIK